MFSWSCNIIYDHSTSGEIKTHSALHNSFHMFIFEAPAVYQVAMMVSELHDHRGPSNLDYQGHKQTITDINIIYIYIYWTTKLIISCVNVIVSKSQPLELDIPCHCTNEMLHIGHIDQPTRWRLLNLRMPIGAELYDMSMRLRAHLQTRSSCKDTTQKIWVHKHIYI